MNVEVKPKLGRPPKEIDWKIFEQLCQIQCTHDELADFLHIAKATLYERAEKNYGEDFPTVYKRFAAGGKASLRRTQFEQAKKNASMAIWLGKVYLGQKEYDDHDKSTINNYTIHVAPDGLASGLSAPTVSATDNPSA